MLISLTRNRLFEIWYVLKNHFKEDMELDKRLTFARNLNVNNLQPMMTELVTARQTGIEAFREYAEKRDAIVQEEPANEMNEDKQKRMDELNDQYKDAISERQKEVDIYNELLSEEIEFDLVKVSFKALPDSLPPDVLNVIRPIIKETNEEIAEMV